jgi:hypothetical protein
MYQINYGHCTVNIAIKRGRVKEYSDRKVYINDGQEFELEFFNSGKNSTLAKIYINGNCISNSGLIIRPGQRIFLDRYLDNNRKFKFSTYEVEDSPEASEAIRNNGEIQVEFYAEKVYNTYPWVTTGTLNLTGSATSNSLTIGSNSLGTFTTGISPLSYTNQCVAGSMETGRIESGGVSSQELSFANESFNSHYSSKEIIQILPVSAKPVTISELRNYCSSCGTRIKKPTWKFCPSCGNNLAE